METVIVYSAFNVLPLYQIEVRSSKSCTWKQFCWNSSLLVICSKFVKYSGVINDLYFLYFFVWNIDYVLSSYTLGFVNTNLISLNIKCSSNFMLQWPNMHFLECNNSILREPDTYMQWSREGVKPEKRKVF